MDEPLAQAGPPLQRAPAAAPAVPAGLQRQPLRWRGWLRAVIVDSKPLRRRDFRLLYLAQTVSFAGSMITYVAIPFQVFRLTRSPLVSASSASPSSSRCC